MKTKQKIISLAFFGLFVLLIGCQAEEDMTQYETHQQRTGVELKKISFSNIMGNGAALQTIETAKRQRRENVGYRGVHNDKYGVFIDTTRIYMIEKDNTHWITFQIVSDTESEEKVENLVLQSKDDGTYKAYITEYILTQGELSIVDTQPISKVPSKISEIKEFGEIAMRVAVVLSPCVEINHYSIDYCTNSYGQEIVRTGGINDGCAGGFHSKDFSVLTINLECISAGMGGNSGIPSNPGNIPGPGFGFTPPGNPTNPGNGPGINPGQTPTTPEPPKPPTLFDDNGNPILTTPILGSVIKSFVKTFDAEQLAWWNNLQNTDEVIQIKEYIRICSVNGTPDIETNKLVKRIIDYLILNPLLTWDDVFNSRTKFDTDQQEVDDYSDGGHDNMTYENFDEDGVWPTIDPVISKEDFVGWGAPGIRRNCMDYAKAQIAKVGYQISNYYASNQTFQIYTSQNGVNEDELAKGLSYLVYALSNGIPVIVGVDDAPGNPGNLDNTTDHFIVIVGMGTDSNGKYFLFYDNASGKVSKGTSPLNKLYYNPTTHTISGTSQTEYAQGQPSSYTVTMIRKSKQL